MHYSILVDIIQHCLAIKERSCMIYKNLSCQSKTAQLKSFWEKLAGEEAADVKSWKELLDSAKDDIVPIAFENPSEIKDNLESANADLVNLELKSSNIANRKEAFILACQVELHQINPVFTIFENYLNDMSDTMDENSYESHLLRFIDAFRQYNKHNPELELLGGTILKIWEQNRQLAVLSNTDSLTGVLNRRGLMMAMKTLGHLSQRNKSIVGVLMVDLDDFKKINDTFGHLTGDAVLRQVAQIIRDRIRYSDVIGRYGGEEFIAVLSPVDSDALLDLAEDLRKKVEEESKAHTPVTISIGASFAEISKSKNVDEELETLISLADKELYKAKAAGKNRVSSG